MTSFPASTCPWTSRTLVYPSARSRPISGSSKSLSVTLSRKAATASSSKGFLPLAFLELRERPLLLRGERRELFDLLSLVGVHHHRRHDQLVVLVNRELDRLQHLVE